MSFFYARHGNSQSTMAEIARGKGMNCAIDCKHRRGGKCDEECYWIIYFCRDLETGETCPLYDICDKWNMPKIDGFTNMILSDMARIESSGYYKWPGALDDQPHKWLQGLDIAFSERNRIDMEKLNKQKRKASSGRKV